MSLTINAFDDASRDYLFNLSNIYLKDISCEDIGLFTEITENKYKVSTTVRRKLGGDIDASCGQLRAQRDGL